MRQSHSNPSYQTFKKLQTKVRNLQEKIRQMLPKEHKLLDKLSDQRNQAFQKWYNKAKKKRNDNDK